MYVGKLLIVMQSSALHWMRMQLCYLSIRAATNAICDGDVRANRENAVALRARARFGQFQE